MFSVVYFRNGFVTPWHTLEIPEIATQECLYCHFITQNHMLPFSLCICSFFQRLYKSLFVNLFILVKSSVFSSAQSWCSAFRCHWRPWWQKWRRLWATLVSTWLRSWKECSGPLNAPCRQLSRLDYPPFTLYCHLYDRETEAGVWRGELPYLCARIHAFLQKTNLSVITHLWCKGTVGVFCVFVHLESVCSICIHAHLQAYLSLNKAFDRHHPHAINSMWVRLLHPLNDIDGM